MNSDRDRRRRDNLRELRKISMKPILVLIVCFLSLSANSFAQTTETFDIATFQPPKGWKKQDKGASFVIFRPTTRERNLSL